MKIEVLYTGEYPNLCAGYWIIRINDVLITCLLKGDMETYGTYNTWYFEDWCEKFKKYTDGLKFNEWIESVKGKEVISLIENKNIFLTNDQKKELFNKISEQDWRHNSCGGCI